MSERKTAVVDTPKWPRVELQRVANGWQVLRPYNCSRDELMPISEVRVFNKWAECVAFLEKVTTA